MASFFVCRSCGLKLSLSTVIQNIKTYLNQPYPCNSQPKYFLKVVGLFALFVASFLYIFQPFGISNLPDNHDLWISLSFGAVTLVSLLFSLLVYQLFPNFFRDENWTLGKEFFSSAFNFFLVGNGNFLFIKYGWYHIDGYLDYGGMMFATFAVGFFPYVFLLLTSHLRNIRLNSSRAEQLTSQLGHSDESPDMSTNAHIELKGRNDGEILKVNPNEIVLISSSGNYIEVFYMPKDSLEKVLLRGSLTDMEESLSTFDQFFRCHRTHLVNLDRVKEVTGNSQGYRLTFAFDIEDIPVARTKNQEFREAIASMSR